MGLKHINFCLFLIVIVIYREGSWWLKRECKFILSKEIQRLMLLYLCVRCLGKPLLKGTQKCGQSQGDREN